jgi:hypothetical protein
MTYETWMMPPAGDRTVRRLLKALAHRDFDRLKACLAADIWFRALLPKAVHESNTAVEAADAYRSWYGTAHGFEALAAEHFRMTGREFLRYRFRVLPPWAPEEWHVIEQAGFCRVKEGRISRLDVVCTGFHPQAASLAERRALRGAA